MSHKPVLIIASPMIADLARYALHEWDVVIAPDGDLPPLSMGEYAALLIEDRREAREIVRKLRATSETRQIGIVLISPYSAAHCQFEAFFAGVDEYMVKPFSPRQMEQSVARALRATETMRQHRVALLTQLDRETNTSGA